MRAVARKVDKRRQRFRKERDRNVKGNKWRKREKKSGKKMLTKGAMSDIMKKLAKSGRASGRQRIRRR